MGEKFDRGFKKFAVCLLSALARVKFRTRKNIIDRPHPGSLIVCNHSSVWDFANLIYALYPDSKLRFVATGVQFDSSRLKAWAFKHLEMIRKTQGASDLNCIKQIARSIKEGQSVVIYTAGMTSFDGSQAWSTLPGTGKLIKLLKTDVYCALTEGGYITKPRYTKVSARGRVDVTVKKIITAEEAASLDALALQARVDAATLFNDWDWQEKNKVPFKGINKQSGLLNLLHFCPNCGALYTLSERKGVIECLSCGLKVKRDAYGFLVPEGGSCPRRLDEWVSMQLGGIKSELEGGELNYTARAELQRQTKPGSPDFFPVCKGELKMDAQYLRFSSGDGSFVWTLDAFQFFILEDGVFMQISVPDGAYRFVFDDAKPIARWFFAHRLLAEAK